MSLKFAFVAAIAGAALVFVVPPALADSVHPNDRAGMLGVGAAAESNAAPDRPNDRAGLLGPGAFAAAGSVGPAAVSPTSADSAFQWVDAAWGAGATLGLVLLAAAVLLSVRLRGRVVVS